MMLKKYWKFNLIFIVILMLHLSAGFVQNELLRILTKPFITISLVLLLISSTSLKGRFHRRLLVGLFFALAGDIMLIFATKSPDFFSYGLFAFLLCHVYYISAFYLDFRSAPELDKKTARVAVFFVALLATGYFFYLRPYLAGMRIPVLIYILVISFMMMMAIFRNQRVNATSFWLIFSGAIFFILSDCVLAYNKFVFSFDHARLYVMSIYALAQYLIIIGGIERKLLTQP